MQTPETNLDEMYDRVEAIESRLEMMDLIIAKHEAVNEAYQYREPKVKESKEKAKEKVEWMKEMSEYLNAWEKRAIEARYRKREYQEELAEVKQQIEEHTNG